MPSAFPDAYADPNLTADRDTVDSLPSQPLPTSPRARSTEPKQEDVYDVPERVTDLSTLTPVAPQPAKESFAEIDEVTDRGSDPYSNNGIPSQDSFLKNQG